jgi:hypothetical protein
VPGLARDAMLFKANFLLSFRRALDVTICLVKGMGYDDALCCGGGTGTHIGSWAFVVHKKTAYFTDFMLS